MSFEPPFRSTPVKVQQENGDFSIENDSGSIYEGSLSSTLSENDCKGPPVAEPSQQNSSSSRDSDICSFDTQPDQHYLHKNKWETIPSIDSSSFPVNSSTPQVIPVCSLHSDRNSPDLFEDGEDSATPPCSPDFLYQDYLVPPSKHNVPAEIADLGESNGLVDSPNNSPIPSKTNKRCHNLLQSDSEGSTTPPCSTPSFKHFHRSPVTGSNSSSDSDQTEPPSPSGKTFQLLNISHLKLSFL